MWGHGYTYLYIYIYNPILSYPIYLSFHLQIECLMWVSAEISPFSFTAKRESILQWGIYLLCGAQHRFLYIYLQTCLSLYTDTYLQIENHSCRAHARDSYQYFDPPIHLQIVNPCCGWGHVIAYIYMYSSICLSFLSIYQSIYPSTYRMPHHRRDSLFAVDRQVAISAVPHIRHSICRWID